MKIIDIYNKVANGEQVPHFVIDEIEYYIGADGFVKDMFGVEVEWAIDKQWLNEEVEIIEEPILTDKEYEDIEEIKIYYDDGDIALDGVYLTSNHSEILANKINTLIRNQKYILEEIKKLKED